MYKESVALSPEGIIPANPSTWMEEGMIKHLTGKAHEQYLSWVRLQSFLAKVKESTPHQSQIQHPFQALLIKKS